jgi:GDP-4-dehydro-6-deoxy-D-mannose reductase
VAPAVLVTGAAGFAGGHLLELLAARGPVLAWSRSTPPAHLAHLATWRRVDLLDREAVREAVRVARPRFVYHCAGSPHVSASWDDTTTPLASNVMATHHLLEALGTTGTRPRVVVTGSATVYARSAEPITESHPLQPGSPYAVTKLAQEALALRSRAEDGVEVVVARAFNHTGPRQSADFAAPAFARQVALIERGLAEPVIRVGNLDAERDLTDVRDTVRAYAALMEQGEDGAVYNVANGIGRSIRTVLDGLIARSTHRVEVQIDPTRLRPNDTPRLVGDATRLGKTTGWAPAIPFDQTLDDLLAWWRGPGLDAELTQR